MRRVLFLFMFVSFAVLANAQDAKKMVRDAKRALQSYNLDQQGNYGKLLEGRKLIDGAVESPEYAADFDAWYLRGQLYTEIANREMLMKSLDPSYKVAAPDASLSAYKSFSKASELAVKGYEKKDALKGLNETVQGLLNYGYDQYQKGDQVNAFSAFEAALMVHEALVAGKEQSPFSKEEDLNNQIFIVGVTALGSGNKEKAEKYLNELLAKNVHKPEVYDALYKLNIERENVPAAEKYLQEGRKRFPQDISLLFSEINHALKLGKLDDLVNRLKEAIAMEPGNLSLYTTLGNVYDNLFQQEKDAAKKQQYFDDAKRYYGQALEMNPDFFDAVYSIGALYYNKAAEQTQQLQELAEDYTAAGIKKYQAKQKEVNEIFKEALPYFQRADSLNPKDKNTLIALKEIHARLNELDKSNEYKERLDALN